MRVSILYNPVAGSGRGERISGTLAETLAQAGHVPHRIASRLGAETAWIDEALVDAAALVVVGGDGAMRMAAPAAARARTPIYHFPTGTENLFARTFGMDRTPARLLAALDGGRTQAVDMARAGDDTFLLMASIGFDADVVHDLAARRGASIRHLSYAMPLARQFTRWRAPRVTIDVDGERIVDGRPGCVVVANACEYGMRLNPAPGASMTDGRLDAVFMPATSRWRLPGLAIACRRGRLARQRGAAHRAGRVVDVTCDPPRRYQVDGDPPGNRAPVSRLRHEVLPDNLLVLLP